MVLADVPTGSSSQGFTIVEAIVTLTVVSIFIMGFFQSYLLLESQRVTVARQAIANDIAYSNLRKFTTLPSGINCSDSGTVIPFTQESVDRSSAITNQIVTAYPVSGCNGTLFVGEAVKIESKVIYDGGKEVIHASIVF